MTRNQEKNLRLAKMTADRLGAVGCIEVTLSCVSLGRGFRGMCLPCWVRNGGVGQGGKRLNRRALSRDKHIREPCL